MSHVNMHYIACQVARSAENAWRRTLYVSKSGSAVKNLRHIPGNSELRAISLRRGGLGIWR